VVSPEAKVANFPTIADLRGNLTLHLELGLKTLEVAKNRGHSRHTSVALKAEKAVFLHDVAVNLDFVPSLHVTDIVDWNIIVLAPEERHLIERRALPKHVQRRGLPLAFGDNPVLDTDVLT
jgi:hypothetical protein